MKSPIRFLPVLIAIAAAFLGLNACDDESSPTIIDSGGGDPEFLVSPDSLFADDSMDSATFYLSATGNGRVEWQVTAAPPWAVVDPASGVTGSGLAEITVHLSSASLGPGLTHGRIELLSTGGKGDVDVFYSVRAHPQLVVSSTSLSFPEGTDEVEIQLGNPGTGVTGWSLDGMPSWLSAVPDHGSVFPGDTVPVTFTADRAGLDPGELQSSFGLQTNAESGGVSFEATLTVPAFAELEVWPAALVLDYFESSSTIVLRSVGNVAASWSIAADDARVGFDATEGSLDAGDSLRVTLSVDRTGLGTGEYPFGVEVSESGTVVGTVDVAVRHFVERLARLDRIVIDAEYDRNADRIVMVSSGPNELASVDPETGSETVVPLSLPPTCVSVSPDGSQAAVGHNAYFTLVDLNAGAVVDVFAVTTSAVDIVLASNGYCYVFPRTDQWETIRCVNLATGVETTSGGYSIRAGTLAKLHPSGDYIYGADNGLSPSDFEKYDIRGGTASVMYDSPYHGDYAFSGNLWISDDGARLFARSGNVFRSSTDQATDMTYNGNLPGDGPIRWVDHSTNADRVLAFRETLPYYPNQDASGLHVYGAQFLELKGRVDVPSFLIPDGSGGGRIVLAEGRFVFFDSTGTRYYALVQAEEGSGMLMDWATYSGDVAELP